MTSLRVRAPGKVNWTLEVLGKRDDGYHELRTILQTVALSDWVTLTPAGSVSLEVSGERASLTAEPNETNLARRAAVLLQQRCFSSGSPGVRIELEKHLPIAAGLGGGSSDAAAVLRGLRALWKLDTSDDELTPVAAELGSDVPFFLHGGCARVSGRGERVEPLPDPPSQRLLLAWPDGAPAPNKTARMYGALREDDHTDGSRTERLAECLRRGEAIRDEDVFNVFERLEAGPDLLVRATPHLCGSGPAVFFLIDALPAVDELRLALHALGLRTMETETLAAPEAAAIEEYA